MGVRCVRSGHVGVRCVRSGGVGGGVEEWMCGCEVCEEWRCGCARQLLSGRGVESNQQIVPLPDGHVALGTQYGRVHPWASFETHLQYLLSHHHVHSVLLYECECVSVCMCVGGGHT